MVDSENPNLNREEAVPPIPPALPAAAAMPQLPLTAENVEQPGPEKPVLDEKQTVKKTMGIVWIYLAMQLFVSLMVMGLAQIAASAVRDFTMTIIIVAGAMLLSLLLGTLIPGITAVAFGQNALSLRLGEQFGKKGTSAAWIGRGFLLMMLCNIVPSLLIGLLQWLFPGAGLFESPAGDLLSQGSGWITAFVVFLTTVVCAPFFEEAVFRGLICRSFMRFNKGFAVVFSALLFGLMHMNFAQGIPAFLMGLALGYVYVRSDSLWICIAMHAANNLLGIAQQGYAAFGWDVLSVLLTVAGLICAAGGIWVVWREHREIGMMFRQASHASLLWKDVRRSVGFWLFAAAFIAVCLAGLLMLALG